MVAWGRRRAELADLSVLCYSFGISIAENIPASSRGLHMTHPVLGTSRGS